MRGRTRKANTERYANGKPKAETVAEIKSVVMAQRLRDVWHPDDAGNELAGFTLGKLLLNHRRSPQDPAGITEDQYNAGEAWARLYHKFNRVVGAPNPNPPSASLIFVDGGNGEPPEIPEDEALRIKQVWRDCYDVLVATMRDHGMAVIRVTYGVCVENWPLSRLSEEDYGSLKIGLNALGRVLR